MILRARGGGVRVPNRTGQRQSMEWWVVIGMPATIQTKQNWDDQTKN
jgi:hypothetical protein